MMGLLLPALLVIAAAVFLARRGFAPDGLAFAANPAPIDDDQVNQLPTFLEEVSVTVDPTTYIPAAVSPDLADANERAFLDMIAYAEGTNRGPDGYRAMFGYPATDRIAPNLDDHPRRAFQFEDSAGRVLWTTAAGRYQFMAISPIPGGKTTKTDTWDTLQRSLGLRDFGPASQDAAALELVRQRGALNDVRAGRLQVAIAKCAKTWASLPGAGYSQPERKLPQLVAAYKQAGGAIEA